MPRTVVAALTLAACLALAGCEGDQPADPTPTGVDAFPDPPHVDGPLTVELRPSLLLMDHDRRCRPAPDSEMLCSADGSEGFRALGTPRTAVVEEVGTRPSTDHTSWGTFVRFAADSRAAVRRARDEAAAVGGVVVVTVGGQSAAVVAPADLRPRRIALFGLERAEAWAVADAFANAQNRSKQGM